MTDTSLTYAAAQKIMEGCAYITQGESVVPWSPLTDWNHCWLLVSRMRERGWYLSIDPLGSTEGRVRVAFHDSELWSRITAAQSVLHGDERRGIGLAALEVIAWQEKPRSPAPSHS